MEAETAKSPDGSELSAFIGRQNPLRRVLNHRQIMTFRDIHDHIHLTGNPGIMDRHDGLRFLRNRRFYLRLIDIHRIRPDIHKNRLRPPEDKSIRRGNKGIGRHDHLIPLPDIRKQRRQLRSMSTGRRQ